MTKKWTALLLAAVLAVGLSACDTSRAEAPGSNLESGVSAIEDAMTKRNETESSCSATRFLRNSDRIIEKK